MASVLTETQEAAPGDRSAGLRGGYCRQHSKAPPAPTATPTGADGATPTETVGESAPEALASPFVTDEQKQCAATADEAMKAREGRGPESVSPDVQAAASRCWTLGRRAEGRAPR